MLVFSFIAECFQNLGSPALKQISLLEASSPDFIDSRKVRAVVEGEVEKNITLKMSLGEKNRRRIRLMVPRETVGNPTDNQVKRRISRNVRRRRLPTDTTMNHE